MLMSAAMPLAGRSRVEPIVQQTTAAVTSSVEPCHIDPLYILRGHQAPVNCITPIVHSGTVYIATGDSTGILRVWSLLTRRSTLVYNVNEQSGLSDDVRAIQKLMHNQTELNSILSIHQYNDSRLAVQCKIGILYLYRVSISEWSVELSLMDRVVTQQYSFCKCLIHDNTLYSVGENASQVYIYDLQTLQLVDTIQCEKRRQGHISTLNDCDDQNETVRAENVIDKVYGMVMHISVLAGVYLLCGMESGHINLYNISNKQLLQSYKAHHEPVMSVSCRVNPVNGQQYVALSCSAGNNIVQFIVDLTRIHQCINESDQTVLQYVADIKQQQAGISDICIRSDAALYGTACWDYCVRVYRLHDTSLLCTLRYHTAHVYCVQFIDMIDAYRELGIVVTCSKDNKVCVWQLYNKQHLPTLPSEHTPFKPRPRNIDTSAFDQMMQQQMDA